MYRRPVREVARRATAAANIGEPDDSRSCSPRLDGRGLLTLREHGVHMSPDNGIVAVQSRRSVEDTVAKLRDVLSAKGVKLFTIIDHDGEARAVGVEMHATKLLIFGNPKAGTPLMLAAPSIALDLPLKLLVS